jgi:hypothetical protein
MNIILQRLLTTQKKTKTETHIRASAGLELAIPATERQHIYVLDRAANDIETVNFQNFLSAIMN